MNKSKVEPFAHRSGLECLDLMALMGNVNSAIAGLTEWTISAYESIEEIQTAQELDSALEELSQQQQAFIGLLGDVRKFQSRFFDIVSNQLSVKQEQLEKTPSESKNHGREFLSLLKLSRQIVNCTIKQQL